MRSLKSLAFGAILLAAATPMVRAQEADFNEVGRQMAIMLQNSHFSRPPLNTMSEAFLQSYLRDLDGAKLYFTQEDIDRFEKSYGKRLHEIILKGESMKAATDIYDTFRKRVTERVKQANEMLAEGKFDFTKDESVTRTRKDAPWPKDEAEASQNWRLQIKEAMLSEKLRRETVARLATEQGKPDPLKDEKPAAEKLKLRYERLLRSVVDADEPEVANFFLSAVAESYDPHTDYMSFREMDRFSSAMKNELVGIGALLQAEEDGATKIMGIVVNGPAERQGDLKLNDRIVAVDPDNSGTMVDIMFMPLDKIVDLIRGKEGSQVKLKVEPATGPPGETKLIAIQRAKVEMKEEQASATIIELKDGEKPARKLGVLTLPSFYADFENGTTQASVDIERLLKRLMAEGIDGLVMDLRGNGGGSLEEVRRMTGFFVPRGPVVQVKNTLGQTQVKDSSEKVPIYSGPMAVLIDKTSASASEILAGALQDYNRAVIIGDSSTFGKGTVQQPMDIGRMLPVFAARDRAGFLKVTIQKFYRPSGSSTQLQGVVSDIVLPNLIDSLEVGEAYLEQAMPHDLIAPAPDMRPGNKDHLFLPRLAEESEKRRASSKDFAYVVEDILRNKARIKENQLSLNEEKRVAELKEASARDKERNAERLKRFETQLAEDRKSMTFYRLTLDVVDKEGLTKFDPSEEDERYMHRAKDATASLDETPKWPSGLDPIKREGLMIVRDLVETTEAAKIAGLIKVRDTQ